MAVVGFKAWVLRLPLSGLDSGLKSMQNCSYLKKSSPSLAEDALNIEIVKTTKGATMKTTSRIDAFACATLLCRLTRIMASTEEMGGLGAEAYVFFLRH